MSKEYIEVDILDVMSVMEGSYPDAEQRWNELKKLIELQRASQQSVKQTICEHGRNITKFHCVDCGTVPLG